MRLRALAALLAAAILAIFAYGYWHTITHATLRVELQGRDRRSAAFTTASVALLDASGRQLARLTADRGVLSIAEPAAHSCGEAERRAMTEIGGQDAYRRCFREQTRWTSSWIEHVTYADVRADRCEWQRVPVALERLPTGPADWWLFWPLPHIGGSPYTSYVVTITLDTDACRTFTDGSRDRG